MTSKKWRPSGRDRLRRFLPAAYIREFWYSRELYNASHDKGDPKLEYPLHSRTQPELKPRMEEGIHPSLPWRWFLPWPSEKESNREDVRGDRRHRDWLLDRGWLPRGGALGSYRLPAEQPSGA